jgi:hypothetical protein
MKKARRPDAHIRWMILSYACLPVHASEALTGYSEIFCRADIWLVRQATQSYDGDQRKEGFRSASANPLF